ncbi:MAG: ExbD/TolR family protein [Myxococcaceae bacterium]
MSLGLGKHLAKKRKFSISEGRPNSDINVTPLVDVVLVLLIIFMVVTPLLEKDIQVRVPDEDTQEVPEPDPNQIVVSIEESGIIKLNSEAVDDASYVERMKRVLAAKPPDERLVFFIPEEKANYARVVFALDGARSAGAKILGVITEPVVGIVTPGEAPPGGAAPGAPPGAPPAPPAPPAEPPK